MLGDLVSYREKFPVGAKRDDDIYAAQQHRYSQLKAGMSHNGPVETQHQGFMNKVHVPNVNNPDYTLTPTHMGPEGMHPGMAAINTQHRPEGKPEDLIEELAKLAHSTGGTNQMMQSPESMVPVIKQEKGLAAMERVMRSPDSAAHLIMPEQGMIKQEPGVTSTPVPPHPPPPQRPKTPTQSQSPDQSGSSDGKPPEVEAEQEVSTLLNVALANKAGRTVHGSPFKDNPSLPSEGHYMQDSPVYSSPPQPQANLAQISPLAPTQALPPLHRPSSEEEAHSKEKENECPDYPNTSFNDSGAEEPKLYIDESNSHDPSEKVTPKPHQRSSSEDAMTSGSENSNNISPLLPSQTNNGWGQPMPATRNPSMDSSWDGNMIPPIDDGSGERYFCHLCSYVGTSQYLFKAHMNSHFEHNCPHCDYTSRTEGRLKKHIKDFHSDGDNRAQRTTPGRPKVFRCKQCDFVSPTKEDFWNHSRIHIKAEKILQCPKCPFVTEYKHHLEYHLRNHFGSKPFKCEKCNYSCVNKSMLNSHMKSHTNIYQYRCADCTYATKYCHSLKLHLHKYNHKPATVLNIDGSLPTDGTGDFDLVSKRGPPRGPRGPRTDLTPPPGNMKNMMPGMGMSPMNGAMMPGPFWPLMGQIPNGLAGPPPLIPVSGMPPMSMNLPGNKLASPQAGSGKPGMPALKCNWCDYSSQNPEKLNMHILKTHASEHQDLFSMFGIRPEAFMEEQAKQAKMMMQLQAANAEHMKNILGSPNKEMFNQMARQELQNQKDAMKAKNSSNHSDHNEENYSDKRLPGLIKPADEEHAASGRPEKGEHPLDLSRHYPQYYDEDSSEMMYEEIDDPSEMRSYQPGSAKKRLIDETNSAAPGRKRSRKGKAYKLDTLCRRLQERDSPSQEDSGDEYYGSESMEGDEDTYGNPDSAESLQQGEGQRTADESNENDQQRNLQSNLNDVHARIRALNGEDSDESEKNENTKDGERAELSVYHQNGNMINGEHEEDENAYQAKSKKEEMNKYTQFSSKYECNFCEIAFKDCVMYTMHMGYHGYKDPFKCNMCGHQSGNKVEFFLHIARAAHE